MTKDCDLLAKKDVSYLQFILNSLDIFFETGEIEERLLGRDTLYIKIVYFMKNLP